MMSLLLKLLLFESPKTVFSPDEATEFEHLLTTLKDGELLSYRLPYPKYRFLQYLSSKDLFLFHGSNHSQIEEFEPREQTLFNNRLTKAVFASSEPNWSIFYAVFDRSKLVGSFRNGCVAYKGKKYHFYSLNEATAEQIPWTEGMVYILPRSDFERSGNGKLRFDEWISKRNVRPIGKILINPEDFYYIEKVAVHKANEHLIKTWFLYKIRALRKSSNTR